jgi:uncharacterized membrane protein
MTDADKEKIRAAISRATGKTVGEIYPELFLNKKRGGIATAVNAQSTTPHTKIAFVTKWGDLTLVGAFGHN